MNRALLLLAAPALLYRVGCDCGEPAAPRAMGVASGIDHSCRLVAGQVGCAGDNALLQLGRPDDGGFTSPVEATHLPAGGPYVAIATGSQSTCALEVAQRVLCWGARLDSSAFFPVDGGPPSLPHLVDLPVPATTVSLSYTHACALGVDGTAWCWGANVERQLGQGPFGNPDEQVPVQIGSEGGWEAISPGDGHTCALRDGGELYCWGRNSQLQLGLGDGGPGNVGTPRRVGTEVGYTQISSGMRNTCAIRAGRLYCWGDGPPLGALREVPTEILPSLDWVEVDIKFHHACAIADGGFLYCWGRNDEGQLGLGYSGPVNVPVPTLVDGGDWLLVRTGRFFTCAMKVDGGVSCWGDNNAGQLGLGDTARRDVPTQQP